jgi:immune inhibitor A
MSLTSRFRQGALGSLLVLLGAALPLAAQDDALPRERFHAPARTHWAQRTAEVAASRIAAALPEGIAARRAPLLLHQVEGTMRQVVIPIHFSDEQVGYSAQEIQQRFYGNETGGRYSVNRYFREASGERFGVEGFVLEGVRLPRSSEEYVGSRTPSLHQGIGDHVPHMLTEALAHADARADWARYVEPGTHRITTVIFVTAGQGGSCPGDRRHVWPHRYNLTELTGQPYRTRSKNSQGQVIEIDDYIVVPAEECGGAGPSESGLLIHETGHLLGLPDLYDVTDSQSRGPVGNWDLMATGNYNRPDSPAMLGAVSRMLLGWIDVQEMSGDSASLTVTDVAFSRAAHLVPFPGTSEFLLLETRTRTGTDQHLPGEGLVVWHVDAGVLEQGLRINAVNVSRDRPGVAVVQADGKGELQAGRNRGDDGDVWPGRTARTTFDASSTPAAKPYAANWTGRVALSGIAWGAAGGARSISLGALSSGEGVKEKAEILPEKLPAMIVGRAYEATLSLSGVESGEVRWTAEGLDALGLAVDAASGRIQGTVRAPSGDTTATVRVAAYKGSESSQELLAAKTYRVPLLQPVRVDIHQLVSAAMDPDARPLSKEALRYVDALGNGNGVYDLGDFVLLVQLGYLQLSPGEIVRYRGVLPPALLADLESR